MIFHTENHVINRALRNAKYCSESFFYTTKMGKKRTFWAHVLKKSLKTVEFMRLLQFDAINFNRKILENRSDKLIICYRIEMNQVDWMVVTVQSTERKKQSWVWNRRDSQHAAVLFRNQFKAKPIIVLMWIYELRRNEQKRSKSIKRFPLGCAISIWSQLTHFSRIY